MRAVEDVGRTAVISAGLYWPEFYLHTSPLLYIRKLQRTQRAGALWHSGTLHEGVPGPPGMVMDAPPKIPRYAPVQTDQDHNKMSSWRPPRSRATMTPCLNGQTEKAPNLEGSPTVATRPVLRWTLLPVASASASTEPRQKRLLTKEPLLSQTATEVPCSSIRAGSPSASTLSDG